VIRGAAGRRYNQPMFDEYRALSNAIRRPVGKWWRRTGWWWLAAIALLMLLDAAIRGALIPYLEGASKAATGASGSLQFKQFLYIPPFYWANLSAVLACTARGLAHFAGLVAASQALHQMRALLRDYPHPAQQASRRLAFLLACASAWPVALVWFVTGSGAVLSIVTLLCHSPFVVGLNAVTSAWSRFPVNTEPWTTLLALLWIIALLAGTDSSTPAWCWASALGWMPVLLSLIEVVHIISLYSSVKINTFYAELPRIEMGLGWVCGAVCAYSLIRCYATGRRAWGHAWLALLIISAVLSGYGGEVPFVRHTPVKGGMAQIEAASAAGIALDLTRSLTDFVASPLIAYQAFEHDTVATEWRDPSESGAAGALVLLAPVQWTIAVGGWGRWIVAPLNLAYLALMLACMAQLLFHSGQLQRQTRAVYTIQR
jgi:hypothetical protein